MPQPNSGFVPVCIFGSFLFALPVCLVVSLSARVLPVMATVYLSRHYVLCAIHVVTLAQAGLPKALGSSALIVWI